MAATLLMMAESAAPVTDMMEIWIGSGRVALTTYCAMSSTAPALIMAREMMSTSATMIVASWPKPSKAS